MSSSIDVNAVTWQRELAQAFRRPDALLAYLDLEKSVGFSHNSEFNPRHFPLLVPKNFADRMVKGDRNDPLLLQVFPDKIENDTSEVFASEKALDPVGDRQARVERGLIQKYAGRVLVVASPACAVHCRYCFRRHFPYENEYVRPRDWDMIKNYLSNHEDVDELILSGGDPLVLNDFDLGKIVEDMAQVRSLKRLRIHTRLPIVLPSRVTEAFLNIMKTTRLSPVIVVHANHPNEISGDCAGALKRLTSKGITVLNQSVLLKRVNDNLDTLAELSRRLFSVGVLPYYLHQLDQVKGAAHFETDVAEGALFVEGMRRRLPGYLVPRFVREIAGEESKTLIL